MPVCASGKYRHRSGNRPYPACWHYWCFPSVPTDCTRTITGNRHYSTGTIEGSILHKTKGRVLQQCQVYGNRHYPACWHYWCFPSVRTDCTRTITGNRHYSTGTIEASILHKTKGRVLYIVLYHPPRSRPKAWATGASGSVPHPKASSTISL